MNKQLRLIPAVAFGLAILSITTLANAQVVLSLKEAALVAKGAGVDVSVQITCNPAVFGEGTMLMLSGGLTQRTGNSTTDGPFVGGDSNWTCTGIPQDLDAIATVTSPRKPFKQGPALIYFGVSLFKNGIGEQFFDGGNFPLQEIQIRR